MTVSTQVSETQSAWDQLRGLLGRLANDLLRAENFLANNNVTIEFVMYQLYKRLQEDQTVMNQLASTTGLDTFVSDILNDGAYVATSELALISTAIDDAKSWIDTNAAGLSLTGDTAANALLNGSTVTNRFTPAQTAALQTELSEIRALIVSS
jgi:hypothetical protein